MVSRIPPPEDDSDNARPPRTTGVIALLLVVAVAIGVWLISGRDPGSGTTVVDDTSASAPVSPSDAGAAESSPTSTPSLQSSESSSPTTDESPTSDPTSDPSSPSEAPTIDPDSGLPTIYLLDLPPEAAETVEAIDRGPPFPYEKDGSTFGNYEGLLPDHERGYYQEFTVETPASEDRGARRIVEGAEGELYWTDDHYASFARILL
ncbi:hypothetical protein BH09ACT12_BH09ACT12_33590 [soil metagenome]